MVIYLQLPQPARRTALLRAWQALAPGGTMLVVPHDSRNLTDGVGGPQDPSARYTAVGTTVLANPGVGAIRRILGGDEAGP